MAEIRKCAEADLPMVMRFIDEHWAKDHVLSWHRPLMDWQHADPCEPGSYHWMLALDEEGLQGLLGFIPTARFDPELAAEPCTWLALWKVRPEARNRSLGLQLLSAVAAGSAGMVAVQGINPKHPPMYKALGYRTGELGQFYVCDPGASRTLLAAPEGFVPPEPRPGRAEFRDADAAVLESLALEPFAPRSPRKTPRYFIERYLKHPVYSYRVHVATLDGRPRALLASRLAEGGTGRALRIVDFLGDERALAECGTAIGGLMREAGCEFADFWQHGLDPDLLSAAGFRLAPFGGDVVVPNFFEPFLQRSVRIEFAVKGARDARLGIFRGDGDQDRPNRIADPARARR